MRTTTTGLNPGQRIFVRASRLRAHDRGEVLSIDGNPAPAWVTAGGVMDADGAGRATINGPGGPVTIDFTDKSKPQRKP